MDDRTIKDDIALRLGLDRPKEARGGRRLMLWAAAGLALVLLLAVFVFGGSSAGYVAERVTRGALTVTVSATGTLKPFNQVDVGAEISGRIVAVHADYNDQVTDGQLLAELDTAELKAKVVQSEAAVANAEATRVEARAKRNRIAALRKSGTSSKEDLDIAQAAHDRAEAAVKQARAQLEVDRTNLARAQIRSPIDGIVLDRKVEAGQTVAAAFQTPVLFTLAEDLKRMRLLVDVDEADVGRVREGQSATFTVDAYSDRSFAAAVRQLRNSPQTTEGVVTYPLDLIVDNPDLALKPGMTANVEIVTAKYADALLLPNGALRFSPPAYAAVREGETVKAVRLKPGEPPPFPDPGPGYGIAWTEKGGAPVPHLLKLGATDGVKTVVEKGDLKAGDSVLVDIAREEADGA